MSIEQKQLGDYSGQQFGTSEGEDDQTAPDQRETTEIPDWREVVGDAETNSKCQRCGEHVTPSFRRTHGDDNQRVWGCLSCYDTAQIQRGAAKEDCDGTEKGGLV